MKTMTLLTIDVTAVILSGIGGFVSIATVVLTILLTRKVTKIQKDVDGKMEQLLEATGAAKKAEGKEEQKAESASMATDVVQAIKDDKDIEIKN